MSSSESSPGPDSTSKSRSLKCEQCGGMAFNITEELAEHNRKEHRIKLMSHAHIRC